ncbi:MAG: UPF0262 family protein [Sphingomonadales bacterium]
MPAKSIGHIRLDDKSVLRRSPEIEAERRIAIADLEHDNVFEPIIPLEGAAGDILSLALRIEDDRLVFVIEDEAQSELGCFSISLKPFRRLVKEYFLICESYFEALHGAEPEKLQAIDMGRRGLHNDGAELLVERLKTKARIDLATARRLFTLLSILHIRPNP